MWVASLASSPVKKEIMFIIVQSFAIHQRFLLFLQAGLDLSHVVLYRAPRNVKRETRTPCNMNRSIECSARLFYHISVSADTP